MPAEAGAQKAFTLLDSRLRGNDTCGCSMTYKILLLPGDGIGPEVMAETERVIHWLAKYRGLSFTIERALVGGAALDGEGVPVTDETMKLAHAADAVLFGAVGGPRWDNNPFDKKPERGLLRLRK